MAKIFDKKGKFIYYEERQYAKGMVNKIYRETYLMHELKEAIKGKDVRIVVFSGSSKNEYDKQSIDRGIVITNNGVVRVVDEDGYTYTGERASVKIGGYTILISGGSVRIFDNENKRDVKFAVDLKNGDEVVINVDSD